jgi:hypothetical protein
MGVQAQTKQEQIAAQRAIIEQSKIAIEQAQQAIISINANPDSTVIINPLKLIKKQQVISFGMKVDSTVIAYLVQGKNSCILQDMILNFKIGEQYYYMKLEDDVLNAYTVDTQKFAFKIELK